MNGRSILRGGAFAVLVAGLVVPACRCSDPDDPLVQDFEGRAGLGKWPKESAGVVELSTDWKADGKASLRIDPGLLATVGSLHRSDFRGYDALRLHVHNPSSSLAAVGFEISDDNDTLYDRHQSTFGAPPGDSTIDIDLSGDLWRGEEGRPYRGPTKTPIDLGDVTRIGFANRGDKPLYIDALTLVREPLAVPRGAFAFDFGKRGSRVMGKTTGVFEDTVFDASKEFGFLSGKPTFLRNTMSYPTPLLGDGLAWGETGFVAVLDGGPYTGWIAFERGGFWEEEATGYDAATLRASGTTVHEHTFSPAGPHFLFQDVEITRVADAESKLVWPAHAAHRFSFAASPGSNTFSLAVRNPRGLPLRVAGLLLAPDTAEGNAFIDAQVARQVRSIQAAFPEVDHGRRPAVPTPPDQPLVVEQRPTGELAHPRDLPQTPPLPPRPVAAIAGHRAHVQLALHAPRDVDLTIRAASVPDTALPAPTVSYGMYGPKRPYSGGVAWIETQYYRPLAPDSGPGSTLRVGPAMSRSLLLDFEIPAGTAPGPVTVVVRFSAGDTLLAELPLTLQVFAVDLPPLPIPTGVFMSALPFGPDALSEERWWQLQESLLRAEGEAGLNTPTGGPGLDFTRSDAPDGYSFSGERALRYLALAKKYGLDRAVVCYSGFLPSIKHTRPDAARFQRSWTAFEAAHGLPPHYLYSYDEPSTDDELATVAAYLGPFHTAGVRTIGFFSSAEGERFRAVLDNTFAPAVSGHTPTLLKGWLATGKPVFLYNRGVGRLSMGSDLFHMIRLGVAGRLEWTGLYTQGFAFDDLDGREPSYGLFVVHDRLGALATPRWLSLREGLLDARIELALARATSTAQAPNAPPAVLTAPQAWPQDYPADPTQWSSDALDVARMDSLRQLTSSAAPK